MSQLTENDIINNAYVLVEQDNTLWDTTSAEYLTARYLLNIAIGRWEHYDNTVWDELWGTLTDAADGDKTVNASDWDYACPTNFAKPSSYVRTVDSSGTSTYWTVKKPQDMAGYSNSQERVCYFTGSIKDGFVLHFNPNVTMTAGDTIKYEYYKQATLSTSTSSRPEMRDPYFASYFIAAHMAEGGLDPDFFQNAEARLETMKAENGSSLALIPDGVDDALEFNTGFGR